MIGSFLRQVELASRLAPTISTFATTATRSLATTQHPCNKRKWSSKWKYIPPRIHPELLDPSVVEPKRCFDAVLEYRHHNKLWRRKFFQRQLSELVQEERVITSIAKGKALARLAEYLIENAKLGDSVVVESLIQGELVFDSTEETSKVRKLREVLLPRYADQSGGYLNVYRLHWTAKPHYNPVRGKMYRKQEQVELDPDNPKNNRYIVPSPQGYCVVEFKGNPLEPLVPPQQQMEQLTLEHYAGKKNEVERMRSDGIVF